MGSRACRHGWRARRWPARRAIRRIDASGREPVRHLTPPPTRWRPHRKGSHDIHDSSPPLAGQSRRDRMRWARRAARRVQRHCDRPARVRRGVGHRHCRLGGSADRIQRPGRPGRRRRPGRGLRLRRRHRPRRTLPRHPRGRARPAAVARTAHFSPLRSRTVPPPGPIRRPAAPQWPSPPLRCRATRASTPQTVRLPLVATPRAGSYSPMAARPAPSRYGAHRTPRQGRRGST